MNIFDYDDGRSSHVPVLSVIPQIFKVRRVLELGYGDMSTNLFLNREVYKHLEVLDSYENNAEYAASIKKPDDHRFKLHLHPGLMAKAVEGVDLKDYDLCFIDDSTTLEERVETIKIITSKPITNTLIVMHDFEHEAYRNAIAFNNLHTRSVKDILPHTGIIWSKDNKSWSFGHSNRLDKLLHGI